jgi:hypothetical protein
MSFTHFSPSTLALLIQSGWSESRRVNTSEFEEALAEAGYKVHPILQDFLSRFGGLSVLHPHAYVNGVQDEFNFVVQNAIDSVDWENVKGASDQINSSLCPIGECSSGAMTLLMSTDGKVFAFYDDLYYVGDSGIDAIEALCSGRELSKIPY